MELAKVTSKGQITIPIDIRKKLGVKEGDKILFIEEEGRVIMMNSSMDALRKAQAAFAGEAGPEGRRGRRRPGRGASPGADGGLRCGSCWTPMFFYRRSFSPGSG